MLGAAVLCAIWVSAYRGTPLDFGFSLSPTQTSSKDTCCPIETCCFFNTKIKNWKPPFTSCNVQA